MSKQSWRDPGWWMKSKLRTKGQILESIKWGEVGKKNKKSIVLIKGDQIGQQILTEENWLWWFQPLGSQDSIMTGMLDLIDLFQWSDPADQDLDQDQKSCTPSQVHLEFLPFFLSSLKSIVHLERSGVTSSQSPTLACSLWNFHPLLLD